MANKKNKQQRIARHTLSPKQEIFCHYYSQNTKLFGNATLSYAEAYDYKLDELPGKGVYGEEDEDGNRELLEPSEYDKAYAVCGVARRAQ